MISFRNLFNFTQKEISFAFDHIIAKKSFRGLRILKCTLPEPADDNSSSIYGKLLIVTPRIAGNATERNRIRRRIKNIFYAGHGYQTSFTWIIIVGPKANELSFDELKHFLIKNILQPPHQEQS